ncbi:MAG: DUF349 domain-containing protein [Spirochaetales bacterium]|nr:DUF349 domain-containing protein [Spirochaetales bacterium]
MENQKNSEIELEKKENKEPVTLDQLLSELKTYSDKNEIAKAASKIYRLKKKFDELEGKDAMAAELLQEFETAYAKLVENLEWVLWANHKAKQKILDELQEIVEKEEGQVLYERFNQLKEQWKNVGPVPQKESKKMLELYRELNKVIHEKCQPFFEEREKDKEKNYESKVAVCEKIEALREPENWKEASEIVITMQKSWDSLGMVPKEKSQELWTRFRKACDDFFLKRNVFYKEYSEQKKKNLEQKVAFCEQAEALAESRDWAETSQKLKDLQKQWNEMGPVPKGKNKNLYKRFRAACDIFFNAQKEYFAEMETSLEGNFEQKVKLCEELETLGDMESDAKFKRIRELQKLWKEIGPAPRKKEKEIWKRFRKTIDEFFKEREGNYHERQQQLEENIPVKEELCRQAEELADSSDWKETSLKLQDLQKQWKASGPVPRNREKELWNRFRSACDTFFGRLKEKNQAVSDSLNENLEEKKALCFQAEIISGVEVSPEESEERGKWQLMKLKENFWFKVVDEGAGFGEKADLIKDLQRQWKTIGPVPREAGDKLWKRFQRACQYFFDKSRK